MISIREACKKLNAKYPNLTITAGYDYDDKWYLIEAVERTDQVDYNDPYYAVSKDDGEVTCFSPAADFDSFFECIDNRELEL